MSKLEIGSKVLIYDRYRFAIPLQGEIIKFSEANDGVQLSLLTSNNSKFPIHSKIWVHEAQLKPITAVSNEPYITKINRPGGDNVYQVHLSDNTCRRINADKVIDGSGDSIMNPTWIKTEQFTYRINQKPITKKTTKPPLGLRPRKFIEEERLVEIGQAIMWYITTTKTIPQEWIDEYNEIVERIHGKL